MDPFGPDLISTTHPVDLVVAAVTVDPVVAAAGDAFQVAFQASVASALVVGIQAVPQEFLPLDCRIAAAAVEGTALLLVERTVVAVAVAASCEWPFDVVEDFHTGSAAAIAVAGAAAFAVGRRVVAVVGQS